MRIAAMIRGLVLFVGGILLSCCGSDDEGSSSSGTCEAVCGCVIEKGGDGATCNSQCADNIAAGGNVKLGCEGRLDAFGFPACKPKCVGFPTG